MFHSDFENIIAKSFLTGNICWWHIEVWQYDSKKDVITNIVLNTSGGHEYLNLATPQTTGNHFALYYNNPSFNMLMSITIVNSSHWWRHTMTIKQQYSFRSSMIFK